MSKKYEMPIPTRSAPKPPGNPISQRNLAWCNNDPFASITTSQPVQKKKPPPRPPPPRIKKDNFQNQTEKPKKNTKPSELFTNFFGLKSTKTQQVNVKFSNNHYPPTNSVKNSHSNNLLEGTVSLIDLSPPGSPTFTTRSSSDGVSIDSFGSDGNSNPSVFTSSGNTSQTESAFEDDFDFFGNLTKRNEPHNDPWKQSTTFDPFSPTSASSNNSTNGVKHIGEASFFAYNNGPTPTIKPPPVNNISMPTIIRARPPKPPAPKVLHTSLAPTVPNFKAISTGVTESNGIFSNSKVQDNSTWPTKAFVEAFPRNGEDSSPPMPSIPPPAPPAEFLTKLNSSVAQVEPEPQGVALYDFEAIQLGDLTLKQGDIVMLTKKINNDWLEGQVDNRVGMFPANFIDIIVPLPGCSSNIVNALYTFAGETWEDLPFEEGAKITVLSRISDEWLYGEYDGKKGQFPANYVDRVPRDLPQYS
ncbi:uncharacterized protein B0303.7 isoform X2 [Chelonus insularis]|uniref:uncharacterized protein B0303.7 isoform X2 n=1 Tax=Chelonus insularis TaxID=460826 RepID=UPI00158D87E7|nr:uncharacterized protein B0303.7 isoform X2 [Chelonus insularis]